MMRHAYTFSLAAFAALCVSAAACGGNVVSGTGASTTGTGAGTTGVTTDTGTGPTGTGGTSTTTGPGGASTGTGGSLPTGDCTSDADCNGGTCAPITPGGWLVCLNVPPQVTSCAMPNPNTQCCSSADCKQGGCWSTLMLPYCGGPAQQDYNECMTDQCTSDVQCASDVGAPKPVCAPAGAFGEPVRFCFTGYCHTDADCTAKPGGVCRPVTGPCCSTPLGLGCVYPGGCATQADCGQGNSCTLDTTSGTGTCVSGSQPCPV